jgi:ABC-type nickel/cobalt efflux system permease component RcnA
LKLVRHIFLICLVGLIFPVTAFAHHISMSFSDWEFKDEEAKVTYRLPLADAVWIMDVNLVNVYEASIEIKVPVDDDLKAKVREYLQNNLPDKVWVSGCVFNDDIAVSFEKETVQVNGTLSCAQSYQSSFEMENHFLVDENKLHTSMATLRFENDVQQCLFRTAQFKCGTNLGQSKTKRAPNWQGKVLPWWDLLAFFIVLLLLTISIRSFVYALSITVLAHAVAPLCSMFGMTMPPEYLLRPALSFLPLIAGLYLWTRPEEKSGMISFLAGSFLLLIFSLSDLIRLSPLVVIGMVFAGSGVISSKVDESVYIGRTNALYLLSLFFGVVHGFILLHSKTLDDFFGTAYFPILIVVTVIVAVVFKLISRKEELRRLTGLFILAIGAIVFMARNVDLPFSMFEYENATAMLDNLVRSRELSGSFLVVALLMSVIIGGLHALTPGHGKTIVAAYLVGTRGRVTDAFILGGIVTFTHTFSVILLAVIALFASKYILPDQLMPYLSVASGLMIFVLGIWLFQLRLRNYIKFGTVAPLPENMRPEHDHHEEHDHDHHNDHEDEHNHDHDHDHTHDHPHAHEHHESKDSRVLEHTHEGVSHTHVIPDTSNVSLSSLIALGVTGGIVPCPDALAILLIAISIGRIAFGLSIIIAFSLGLAAVLIAIGIVMVKARPLLDRFTGEGRFTSLWLPLLSAFFVTALGLVMLWKAV